ncbi:hypothetical protein ACFW34_35100 [Streptomyces sp. NPDC058848]|uniref:hypothetical protein n=1 Tax=Streptomyces sp. NPDC058848 TaxID=3346650 RepID=UPI003684D668
MSAPEEQSTAITLARIEGKLDHVILQGSDHERRLRVLEARQWPLPSVAALLSVAALIVPFVR